MKFNENIPVENNSESNAAQKKFIILLTSFMTLLAPTNKMFAQNSGELKPTQTTEELQKKCRKN